MKYKITAIAALLAVAFISFAVTGISGDTVDAKGEKKGASVEFSVSLFGDPDFALLVPMNSPHGFSPPPISAPVA